MLPKPERLAKAALIKRTYGGKKLSHPLFTIYALPRRLHSQLRLPLTAFVVGKKVHLRSTQRNLVKRRLREAYRIVRKELPNLGQWYSMVVVGRDKINSAKWDEIKSSLLQAITCLNSTIKY